MLRQDKEILQFDTIQVDNEINKNNEYKLDTEEVKILIKYNLKNEKEQKYFSIIEIKNVCKYIGILSDNFTKEKLGINYYGNKDIYLGEWKNNLKDGNIYMIIQIIKKKFILENGIKDLNLEKEFILFQMKI